MWSFPELSYLRIVTACFHVIRPSHCMTSIQKHQSVNMLSLCLTLVRQACCMVRASVPFDLLMLFSHFDCRFMCMYSYRLFISIYTPNILRKSVLHDLQNFRKYLYTPLRQSWKFGIQSVTFRLLPRFSVVSHLVISSTTHLSCWTYYCYIVTLSYFRVSLVF
jgi:hypothetical protein